MLGWLELVGVEVEGDDEDEGLVAGVVVVVVVVVGAGVVVDDGVDEAGDVNRCL